LVGEGRNPPKIAEGGGNNVGGGKDKTRTRTLRALEKRRTRGAGIILEPQGGRSKDYTDVIKRCEREISLQELDIPPLGVRKTRSGAVLIEIKCERQEEKAEELANRMKEIIKSIEGTRIWRPSRRLKLRLTGLSIGATVIEVANSIARARESGEIQVDGDPSKRGDNDLGPLPG